MKVILDRRPCNCWDAACEAHFAWHFLGEKFTPVDCTVETIDDGRDEVTFCITDRDGLEKTLVVNRENWAEAYDSWIQALQAGQATK